MRRVLLALSLALALLPVGAASAASVPTLPDVEDEVMCPVCGTSLNLAESPQADRERAFIRSLIDRGETKGQIKRRLVDQYGPQVLATPPGSGFDLAAYLVPILIGIAALLALVLALARWRGRKPRAPANAPVPGAGPLAPADARRLDEDLARYDR